MPFLSTRWLLLRKDGENGAFVFRVGRAVVLGGVVRLLQWRTNAISTLNTMSCRSRVPSRGGQLSSKHVETGLKMTRVKRPLLEGARHITEGRKDAAVHFLSALQQYERSLKGLPYDELPPDLYTADAMTGGLDLSRWTLVVSDGCLERIADRNRVLGDVGEGDADFRGVGCKGAGGGRGGGAPPTLRVANLRSLDLSGGERITDAGLSAVAGACGPSLSCLSLEGAYRITDAGLRSVARSCPYLRELALSGCLAVSGTGFAILGQHARRLTALKLSGCRQIKPWTFMKIFEGCQDLEELDLSYCTLITDQELGLLSDYCKKILRLNVKECSQISDVGLLSLSKGCSNLSEIDLSRSELVFKVTDVSLLGLGEGCRALTSINLRGCEMVTDVGLSWLSRGCAGLRHIDLSNCSKITNGGMRCLGEECSQLRSIILTSLKKVSDVGLRHLADGCHSLEHLNGSGLYLVSDGINRGFGFEGLQALARSQCARSMKKFNMHGCFRICLIALKSIASFTELRCLTLSGCTKLVPEGLSVIARSCQHIHQLSLAACGDCITDECVEDLGNHMPCLGLVDLRDCAKVSRKGFTALSKCSQLRQLNVSGCKGVTDDAILILCSESFNPGLDLLNISQCSQVTNTALTYIVDGLQGVSGLDVTLTTLSLKGTKVTVSALRAVCDQFRYSTVKKNHSFFGLWPMSRPIDRKAINAHGRLSNHATKIQANFRAQKDRNIAAHARAEFCKKKVAIKLGAAWRGRGARKVVRRMCHGRWLRHVMAMRLQCFFRSYAAKRKSLRMRQRQWLLVAPCAARTIQKLFRGRCGRSLVKIARLRHTSLLKQREEAAVDMQSFYHMVNAIRTRSRLLREREEEERLRDWSSQKVQQCWRMYKAREVLHFRKFGNLAVLARRFRAAKTIFTCWRRHYIYILVQRRIALTQTQILSATIIQIWIRERYIYLKKKAAQAKLHKLKRQCASIIIQCALRQRAAYCLLLQLRKLDLALRTLQKEKSFVLTRWWRVCLARHRVIRLRQLYKEEMEREIEIEIWAATVIAAGWRGKLGRKSAVNVREGRKERWKQLWSNEDNRHFFFNQVGVLAVYHTTMVLVHLYTCLYMVTNSIFILLISCFKPTRLQVKRAGGNHKHSSTLSSVQCVLTVISMMLNLNVLIAVNTSATSAGTLSTLVAKDPRIPSEHSTIFMAEE